MKVLLIFPASGVESRQGRKEPLGICYISAYLKNMVISPKSWIK